MILEKVGTVMCKDSFYGDTDVVYLSYPRPGKHISFDGRWLHGAPSSLEPDSDSDDDDDDDGDDEEEAEEDRGSSSNKRQRTDPPIAPTTRRITFLVNVWLNHQPLGSERYPADKVKHLSNHKLPSNLVIFSGTDDKQKQKRTQGYPDTKAACTVHKIAATVDGHQSKGKGKGRGKAGGTGSGNAHMMTWNFGEEDEHEIAMQIPAAADVENWKQTPHGAVRLEYPDSMRVQVFETSKEKEDT